LSEEAEEEEAIGDQTYLASEDKVLLEAPTKGFREFCSALRLWKHLLQASILFAGLFAVRKVVASSLTNLHNNFLIPDNTSFSS
jgi:hypothetical protein